MYFPDVYLDICQPCCGSKKELSLAVAAAEKVQFFMIESVKITRRKKAKSFVS
jgi:hypothetical protein